MRHASWLLVCLPALAQPTSVTISGLTSQQAVFSMVSPCGDPVKLEWGTDPSFAAVNNDVNAAYFTGANYDTRNPELMQGVFRTVVLGKRYRGYADVNGVMRSRSAQAGVTQYYRFTACGGSVSGSYVQPTIPWGLTFPEPYPASLTTAGAYDWPVLTTPAGYLPANNNEQIVDVMTGTLVNRVTGSRMVLSNPNSATGLPDVAWVDTSGSWVVAGTAVFTATGSGPNPKLYVPVDVTSIFSNFNSQTQTQNVYDYVVAVLTGLSSAGGADGAATVWLTKDGGVTAASPGLALGLTTGSAAYNIGGTNPFMADWWAGATPKINTTDMYRSTTTASLATGVLTRSSGDYFNRNLTAGSSVWICSGSTCTFGASTRYTVASVSGPASITISSPPVDGTYTVLQPGFGILIQKNTTTVGTSVTISASTFNVGWSYAVNSYLNGAYMDWASGLTSAGYRTWSIVTNSAFGLLGWLNPATAKVNVLGLAGYPFGVTGNGAAVNMSGGAGAAFDASDPTSYYGMGKDASNNIIIAKVTAASNSQASFPLTLGTGYQSGQSVTNISPAPYNLLAELHSFNSAFDTSVNTSCTVDGVQGNYLIGRCGPGTQDNMPGAWVWAWSITAGVAGAANNPIANMVFSDGSSCRYCVVHGIVQSGNTTWVDVSTNCAGGTGSCRSNGTWTAPLFSGSFDARFGTTLASGMTAGQTTMTVAGQPSATTIAVGDVFQIGTGVGSELVKVTDISSAPTYGITRGYNQGGVGQIHSISDNVMGICTPYAEAAGDALWWNLSDGTVSIDSTIPGGHRMYRSGVYAEQNGSAACTSATSAFSCTAVRDGVIPGAFGQPISYYANVYGPFAGLTTNLVNGSSHPHLLQANNLSYATDTFLPNPYPATTAALVGGKTYLYQITGLTLHRKLVPTIAFSGDKPLLDISGPSSVLHDTSADWYKFCVAAAVNECLTGSAIGNIYANLPRLTTVGCAQSDTEANGNWAEDICVQEANGWWLPGGAVVQSLVTSNDPTGTQRRILAAAGYRYHRIGPNFASPGGLSPGSEVFAYTLQQADGIAGALVTALTPSLPPIDSAARQSFQPLTVQVPAWPGADNAIVEFGYDEWGRGISGMPYCGQRRELCAAQAAVINLAVPYSYETTDAPAGLACSAGCTIVVPAVPNRVVWYRWKVRSGNNALESSPMKARAM